MHLQRAHDLSTAAQPDPDVAKRARLQEGFPGREMFKRGGLAQADGAMLEWQLARFFAAGSKSDMPPMPHAAKKTHYATTPPARSAWLFRVRQTAKTLVVKPCPATALRNALPHLAALMPAPEETRHVAGILAECGVHFVVVEMLPASGIDGVCLWLDPKSPLIGMSPQRDYSDNFWFGLRHEIGHVPSKRGQKQECIDAQFNPSQQTDISEEARVANAAGEEFGVPRPDLEDFMARIHPFYPEQRVLLFAQKKGLHRGIVAGPLHHRRGRHDLLKRHQAKTRQCVTSSATTDGC